MKMLIAGAAMAMVWSLMAGAVDLVNLAEGFVVGLVILWFMRFSPEAIVIKFRPIRFASLAMFFVWELILANLRVAWEAVTPHPRMRPGLVAIPLDAKTALEITTLANLISLTPGTLSLDVSEDRKTLYIYALHVEDPEALRRQIKDGFERRVTRALT